jgi:hypothetical protein
MSEYMGEEIEGDDDGIGEDDLIGALKGGARRARKPTLRTPAAGPTRKRGYVGLGFVTYGAAESGIKTLEVEPQRDFRPERLVIVVTPSSGAAPSVKMVEVVNVGVDPQSPSSNAAPIEMFGPLATHSGVDFAIVKSGQKFTVKVSIDTVPGGGENVKIAVGALGDMLY